MVWFVALFSPFKMGLGGDLQLHPLTDSIIRDADNKKAQTNLPELFISISTKPSFK